VNGSHVAIHECAGGFGHISVGDQDILVHNGTQEFTVGVGYGARWGLCRDDCMTDYCWEGEGCAPE